MMLDRENRVILGFVGLAIFASLVAGRIEALPAQAPLALLIGIGVIAPLLVNERLADD
jgi:hypothetical protein